MFFQIINPVAVMDGTILFHHVQGTQAIFHDEKGHLITVIEFVEGGPKSDWVNLPAPVRSFQIRIGLAQEEVACGGLLLRTLVVGVTGHRSHIVRKTHKVNRILLENGFISWLKLNLDIVFLEETIHVTRIGSPNLDIRIKEVGLVLLYRMEDVIWMAGCWISLHPSQHTAHLVFWVNLMGSLGRQA